MGFPRTGLCLGFEAVWKKFISVGLLSHVKERYKRFLFWSARKMCAKEAVSWSLLQKRPKIIGLFYAETKIFREKLRQKLVYV